jgi:hypothetical protein
LLLFNQDLRSERFLIKGDKLHTQGNKSRLERKILACLEKLTAYEINILKNIVSLQRFKT